MEIQQTQMTHAMHAARLKNPKAGRELAAQALTHSKKAFAVKVAEHPEFKAEIEKFKKDIKPTNLAKLDGFTGIADRLKQGKITSEDIKVLTTQLRNKALEHTRSQVQDRDRGGRSK